MLDIANIRPTAKALMSQLDVFEDFCQGHGSISPQEFLTLNQDLSIGTVLMMGSRRYEKTPEGNRLFWKSMDQREYDLGYVRDAKVLRDYPGYNAQSSLSLRAGQEILSEVIPSPRGKGSFYRVELEDGTEAIAPNYRMAVRNVILKSHLKSQFNKLSLADLWGRVWGNA